MSNQDTYGPEPGHHFRRWMKVVGAESGTHAANLLGVNPSAVYQYLSGKSRPPSATRRLMAMIAQNTGPIPCAWPEDIINKDMRQ